MKKTILMIVVAVVIAGVSGGGVYLWQNNKANLEKQVLQKQIIELQNKDQTTNNSNAANNSNTKTNLKTYTDGKYGFNFQYPSDLEISPIPYTLNVFAGLDGIVLSRANGGGYVATIAIEQNTDKKTLDQAVDSIVKRYGPTNGVTSSSIKVDSKDGKLYIPKNPNDEYNLVNTGVVVIPDELILYIMGGTKDNDILKTITDTFKFWRY